MGFFSWRTQDTNKSIPNSYSSRKPFTVYMTDNKGNKWREDNYDGYGDFGGKDYFDVMAEMNGVDDREKAIDLQSSIEKKPLYPNLSENPNWVWRDEEPEQCEYQGYFYPEDEIIEDD